jgi:hypothetical protein
MKKFIASMLVVTAMVISGCAKSDTTTPPADATKPETTTETPADPAAPPADPAAPAETK